MKENSSNKKLEQQWENAQTAHMCSLHSGKKLAFSDLIPKCYSKL